MLVGKAAAILQAAILNTMPVALIVGCTVSDATANNKPDITSELCASAKVKSDEVDIANEKKAENKADVTASPRMQATMKKPFDYLETIQINSRVTCGYNEKSAQVINKKLADLPADHPLYEIEGPASADVLVMEFKIDQHSDSNCLLVFSNGPSNDPAFSVYDSKTYKVIKHFPGTEIYIPGNNTLYVSGRENNYYRQKKKYVVEQSRFQEVSQPFYHVGLKSKTLKPIRLYSDQQLTSRLAFLPANYDIEILLAAPEKIRDNHSLYLVKTTFGLVGWVKLKDCLYGQPEMEVEGLFMMGD